MERSEREQILRQGPVSAETPRARREREALAEDIRAGGLRGRALRLRLRNFKPAADGYLSALGGPLFILASAAQGYLRGVGDLKTPLLILVAAHVLNISLELLFVYGFDWGLKGSAWGTVIAQAGMGTVFVIELHSRRVHEVGATPHPDEAFMRQITRTLTMADQPTCRVLICDRGREVERRGA